MSKILFLFFTCIILAANEICRTFYYKFADIIEISFSLNISNIRKRKWRLFAFILIQQNFTDKRFALSLPS